MRILISNVLLIFIFTIFVLGQITRYEFGNGLAINLLDLAVLAFTFYELTNKKIFHITPFTKPFAFFILVCMFSLLINMHLMSLPQFFGAVLYLIRWIFYMGIFLIAYHFNKQQKIFIEKLLIISGIILVIFGYLQYVFYSNLSNLFYLGWDNHLYRLFSTFLDPNFAGAFYCLFSLLIGDKFLRLLYDKNQTRKYLYAVLLLFTFVALFLTFSRSALIMLVVSWIVLLHFHKKLKYIFVILLIIIVYIILISPKFYVENINLFRTFSSKERINSAQTAVTIFNKNPIFGVGFNAYRAAQLRYHFRTLKGVNSSHADGGTDNSFLFVAATTGVIGLLAYLYLWITILKYAIKLKSTLTFPAIFISSIIGLFVDSLFLNSIFYPQFILWMAMLIGIMDYR